MAPAVDLAAVAVADGERGAERLVLRPATLDDAVDIEALLDHCAPFAAAAAARDPAGAARLIETSPVAVVAAPAGGGPAEACLVLGYAPPPADPAAAWAADAERRGVDSTAPRTLWVRALAVAATAPGAAELPSALLTFAAGRDPHLRTVALLARPATDGRARQGAAGVVPAGLEGVARVVSWARGAKPGPDTSVDDAAALLTVETRDLLPPVTVRPAAERDFDRLLPLFRAAADACPALADLGNLGDDADDGEGRSDADDGVDGDHGSDRSSPDFRLVRLIAAAAAPGGPGALLVAESGWQTRSNPAATVGVDSVAVADNSNDAVESGPRLVGFVGLSSDVDVRSLPRRYGLDGWDWLMTPRAHDGLRAAAAERVAAARAAEEKARAEDLRRLREERRRQWEEERERRRRRVSRAGSLAPSRHEGAGGGGGGDDRHKPGRREGGGDGGALGAAAGRSRAPSRHSSRESDDSDGSEAWDEGLPRVPSPLPEPTEHESAALLRAAMLALWDPWGEPAGTWSVATEGEDPLDESTWEVPEPWQASDVVADDANLTTTAADANDAGDGSSCFAVTHWGVAEGWPQAADALLRGAFAARPGARYAALTLPPGSPEPAGLGARCSTVGPASEDAGAAKDEGEGANAIADTATGDDTLLVVHREALSGPLAVRPAEPSDARAVAALVGGLPTARDVLGSLSDASSASRHPAVGGAPLAFVATCGRRDRVIGVVTLIPDVDTARLSRLFDLSSLVNPGRHDDPSTGRSGHAELDMLVLNGVWARHSRFVLSEAARQAGKTCLWYALPEGEAPQEALTEFTPAPPRSNVGHLGLPAFSLGVLPARLWRQRRTPVTARIVVCGAGATGLGLVSSLVGHPSLDFQSITVVAPEGLPAASLRGADDLDGMDGFATGAVSTAEAGHGGAAETATDASESPPADPLAALAARLGLGARVGVVRARLVGIDRGRRCALLDDGSEVPFECLILATGSRCREAERLAAVAEAEDRPRPAVLGGDELADALRADPGAGRALAAGAARLDLPVAVLGDGPEAAAALDQLARAGVPGPLLLHLAGCGGGPGSAPRVAEACRAEAVGCDPVDAAAGLAGTPLSGLEVKEAPPGCRWTIVSAAPDPTGEAVVLELGATPLPPRRRSPDEDDDSDDDASGGGVAAASGEPSAWPGGDEGKRGGGRGTDRRGRAADRPQRRLTDGRSSGAAAAASTAATAGSLLTPGGHSGRAPPLVPGTRFKLRVRLGVACGPPALDPGVRAAADVACLVADSHLVVGPRCATSDPCVLAVGSCARVSSLCAAPGGGRVMRGGAEAGAAGAAAVAALVLGAEGAVGRAEGRARPPWERDPAAEADGPAMEAVAPGPGQLPSPPPALAADVLWLPPARPGGMAVTLATSAAAAARRERRRARAAPPGDGGDVAAALASAHAAARLGADLSSGQRVAAETSAAATAAGAPLARLVVGRGDVVETALVVAPASHPAHAVCAASAGLPLTYFGGEGGLREALRGCGGDLCAALALPRYRALASPALARGRAAALEAAAAAERDGAGAGVDAARARGEGAALAAAEAEGLVTV